MQNSKNNMNMEDIMRMNEVLKPYQERSKETEEENLDERCEVIEVRK